MALMLRSHGLLAKAKRLGSSGAARSGVVTATAATVGLVAGKRQDANTIPLVALGAGAALNLVGMTALGDGAMAAGATILGYKMGAKGERQKQIAAAPTRPVAARQKKRGFFRRA